MSVLKRESWEEMHPLNGRPCPVSGRLVHVKPEWIVDRPDYRLRTGILERGIVMSLPVGYTAMADTNRFFQNMASIRLDPLLDKDHFVLVEDYSFHTGSDHEGRLTYISRMVKEVQPTGMVFFTRSNKWRVPIKLGSVVGGSPFPIRIASSYREALQIASEMLQRPIEGMGLDVHDSRLDLPHFLFHAEVIHPHLAQITVKGAPHKADLQIVKEILQNLGSHHTLETGFLEVISLEKLGYVSLDILLPFLKLILKHDAPFPEAQKYLIYTQSFPVKMWLQWIRLGRKRIALQIIGSKEQLEKSLEQAQKMESGKLAELSLALLENLDWETPGFPALAEVNDPAMQPLVLALGALKQDMDFYLAERRKELEQLESVNKRSLQLSDELEDALLRAEKARTEAMRLAVENSALQSEVEKSQQEVFAVLARYIDQRVGLPENQTGRLANLVARVSILLGTTEEDAMSLHNAVLLHHVGYLRIAEGAVDDLEHCQIGRQSLDDIQGARIPYAGSIAFHHHDRWDREGTSTPKEARLVIACYVLLESPLEILEESLKMESGRRIEPELAVQMLSKVDSLREVLKNC